VRMTCGYGREARRRRENREVAIDEAEIHSGVLDGAWSLVGNGDQLALLSFPQAAYRHEQGPRFGSS
jgi:hypothetical protein